MDEVAAQLAAMSRMGVQLGPHLRTMLAGRGANVAPPELDECVALAQKHREEGNALFEKGEDQKAAAKYEAGIGLLRQFDDYKTSKVTALHVALHLNCGLAHFRMERWNECAAFCSPVIALQPEGDPGIARGLTLEGLVKAMYRRGVSYSKLHRWQDAERDLAGCMRTGHRTFAEPARRELVRMRNRWDAERAAENKRTGFGGTLAHAAGGVYTDIDVARREKWIERHREQALTEKAFHDNNKKRVEDGKLEIEFDEWNAARVKKKVDRREREEKRRETKAAGEEAARREKRLAAGVERVVVADEEGLEKGYRRTETGGETPYFAPVEAAKEADPMAAELEAAAAPTPLETPPEVAAPRVSQLPSDQTKWCLAAMAAHLGAAAFGADAAHEDSKLRVDVKTTRVAGVAGDAAIQVLAGVRRYVFDLQAGLEWEAEVRGVDDKFALFFNGTFVFFWARPSRRRRRRRHRYRRAARGRVDEPGALQPRARAEAALQEARPRRGARRGARGLPRGRPRRRLFVRGRVPVAEPRPRRRLGLPVGGRLLRGRAPRGRHVLVRAVPRARDVGAPRRRAPRRLWEARRLRLPRGIAGRVGGRARQLQKGLAQALLQADADAGREAGERFGVARPLQERPPVPRRAPRGRQLPRARLPGLLHLGAPRRPRPRRLGTVRRVRVQGRPRPQGPQGRQARGAGRLAPPRVRRGPRRVRGPRRPPGIII